MRKINKKVTFDDLMPLITAKLGTEGIVRILSMGNSMYPLFSHKRDQVFLEQIDISNLKKYDMILYQRDSGQYVLHRIVGIGEKGFILRGDAQTVNEYPIREDQVIAKVSGFVRKGREHSCDEALYRLYVLVWTHIVLLRRIYRKGKFILRKIV